MLKSKSQQNVWKMVAPDMTLNGEGKVVSRSRFCARCLHQSPGLTVGFAAARPRTTASCSRRPRGR